MGVHDQAATQKAKELLGIPSDEPVFILRAQDILYGATLAVYGQLYASAAGAKHMMEAKWEDAPVQPTDAELAFLDHMEAVERNGRIWQRKNYEKVKLPDMN